MEAGRANLARVADARLTDEGRARKAAREEAEEAEKARNVNAEAVKWRSVEGAGAEKKEEKLIDLSDDEGEGEGERPKTRTWMSTYVPGTGR